MTTWIALLRGVNVGGNNPLRMKELVVSLESIGCSNVITYIQSGNIVFRKAGNRARQLSQQIGETILQRHGFAPKVCLLSAKKLQNVIAANPFPNAVAEPKTLHVFFLAKEPRSANFRTIKELATDNESFALTPSAFFLHAPDGTGRSKLAARVERLLGVDVTARNWRTVSKLQELASASQMRAS